MGSLNAKIGIATGLSYSLSAADDTQPDLDYCDGDNRSPEERTWRLEGGLFNIENVLTWAQDILKLGI